VLSDRGSRLPKLDFVVGAVEEGTSLKKEGKWKEASIAKTANL
jgi:hypothetical protein